MRAHIPRYRTPIVSALAILIAALACSDLDRLVGLSGDQAPGDQTAPVRPEERRAAELSGVVPGLAGFFYDTAGNVVVAVKGGGGATVSRARLQPLFQQELARSRRRYPAADIVVHVAQYTFLELRNWRDGLEARRVLSIPGVAWLDLDEVANRVAVGLEAGGDLGAIRALARDAGVPAEALDIERTTPYVSQSTLQDQFRPIQGGIQIQRVSGTSRATCTLGFAALRNNEKVFLTAGHCSPNLMATDSVAQFQPLAPLTAAESAATTAIGRETFRYSEACGNRRCANSDAAIYGVTPSQLWGLGRIARPTSGCMPGPCSPVILNVSGYWVIDTTRESFVVNDLVSKIGSATGWSQGLVTRTCVDVSPTSGATYHCQMFASYGANDGDSGSPILLDIQGGTDSTVTLGGIHSGKSGSNAVFSPWSGIVQDYGSLLVVPAPPAAWTSLTDGLPDLDTSRVVTLPGDTLRVFRTDITLTFKTAVTETEKQAFFSNHSMTSIQVTPSGRFFVRIPDRGPSADSLLQTIASLRNEPQVAYAGWVLRSEPSAELSYRFPIDGPGLKRADWVPTSPTSLNTWAMRAIRAPLAWGCETGDYDNTPVKLGILEYKHQSGHPEFLRSSPHLWPTPEDPNLSKIAQPAAQPLVEIDETHAIATSGLLAAEGNNNSGIAGVNWKSDLYLYDAYTPSNRQLPFQTGFYVVTGRLKTDAPRVLSLSIDQKLQKLGPTVTQQQRDADIKNAVGELSDLLNATPGLLIVVAAGNARYRGSVANYYQDSTATLLLSALLTLRQDSSQYRDRIIVVAGTSIGNNFWDVSAHSPTEGSNFFTGVTDIAAPAQDVAVLDRWTGQTGSAVPTVFETGTSLSAPLVAGVAGLLLAMDPTLTPAEVKGYILRGARQARPDPQTGQVNPASVVSGAPETIYQLDAYGSLTLLAADRQRIPLCRNRVWVQNNTVYAERDSAQTVEELVHLNGPRSYVNVRHGGRRIEASDDTSTVAFEFQQDHWAPTQNPATTSYGGTFVSMEARSHDLDTLVTDQSWTVTDTALLEFTAHTFNPNTQRIFDTLPVPLARFTGSDCINRDWWGNCVGPAANAGSDERVIQKTAYAPVGNRLFVAVNYLVTRWVAFGEWRACRGQTDSTPNSCRSVTYQEVSERSNLYSIDLTTGRDTLLWPTTGQLYWLGVSEDGGQLVTGEGVLTTVWTWQPTADGANYEFVYSNPGTVTGCGVHYRSVATGAEVRAQIPTTDGCTYSTRGNGTIAPAPIVH